MTLSVAFPNLYQMKEFIKVTTTLVNTAIGRGGLATYRFGARQRRGGLYGPSFLLASATLSRSMSPSPQYVTNLR
jgi:hypothetical protein